MADLKRMQDALEKAYDDEVGKLFAVLVEGLIDIAGPSPLPDAPKASQVTFRFAKGMKLAGDARDRAMAVVSEMAK